ncbi:putative transcriptional regulator [Xylanimonas cellulosilytica DSM 15894]|uniref:Transcriptional regulator n=1 Tax=Xylanimonas cellulosilytica (strain DSM 15894 / JCM 12276 / CECT 5975 / KCTC 9989 / LMG 20990 / NBRC 107835 / XIL07) TaxID=446471 RepID=D1BSG9_XYLCX|nr:helix-turn-helix domain-containing protein [Xylanimonas cellulosilytica]ACZ30661.1 putative transcriptional regulator [Xylanimonas cellulosilytica DSM 15894]
MTDDTHGARVHAVLASPVRTRVLDLLSASPDAPTAQQLAAELGLHVTTVRFHLEQLEAAGLVGRETRRRAGRGRPGVHFRLVGAGLDGPDLDAARDEMIGALAEAVAAPDGATRTDAARSAGHRWAERLPVPAAEPQAAVAQAFTHLGFGPEPDGDALLLRSCPFRQAAREHPQVVCAVHLGLAERLAARAPHGEDVQVTLRPFVEPELCVVHLRDKSE